MHERAETIFALRRVSRAYGSIQEVIVQNFRAKPATPMRHAGDLSLDEFRATIAVSRIVLGPKARVQAPPQSCRPSRMPRLAGRRGGRLGWHLPADARSRQPGTSLALDRAAACHHSCVLAGVESSTHGPPDARERSADFMGRTDYR